MTKMFAVMSVLAWTVAASAAAAVQADPIATTRALLDDENSNYVMVVAHRACWAGGVPENSVSAIRACIDLGADMVEIDVALTSDNIPVLMHDPSVDRMTDGTGQVSDLTLTQVRSLRLRAATGGPDAALTNERVPTLREALEAARGRILINLDVKGPAYAQAFAAVEAVGVGKQILMKTALAPDDAELRDAPFLGKTLFMPIIRECTRSNETDPCTNRLSEYAPAFRRYQPIAYEITYSNEPFFAEGVATMTALGARIWVNTLNPTHAAGIVDDDAIRDPAATWGRIISMGADIIQTDRPRELIEYLTKTGRRQRR